MLTFWVVVMMIGTAMVSVGLTIKVMEARYLRDSETDR